MIMTDPLLAATMPSVIISFIIYYLLFIIIMTDPLLAANMPSGPVCHD